MFSAATVLGRVRPVLVLLLQTVWIVGGFVPRLTYVAIYTPILTGSALAHDWRAPATRTLVDARARPLPGLLALLGAAVVAPLTEVSEVQPLFATRTTQQR